MLTNEERIRAVKCNLKSFDWTVTPQYRLEREDAEALLELLTDSESIRDKTKNNIIASNGREEPT